MADAVLQVSAGSLECLDEREVRKVLKTLRPQVAEAAPGHLDSVARVVSVVWAVIGELPKAKRRRVSNKDTLRAAILGISRGGLTGSHPAQDLRPLPKAKIRTSAKPKDAGEVEHSRGSGLGAQISLAEGRARLDRYTALRPLETWAGPTAGAGEIKRDLGIPRSTLSNWKARRSVIGLLRGERKLAYPLEQFVDARPMQGIADVLKVAPDERAAWLWLRQPHPALTGKMPLEVLKAGGREAVARAAERDFAQGP